MVKQQKDRMMVIRHDCSHCIYARPETESDVLCCRHAPTPAIADSRAVWPIVRPWHHCGEWSYTFPVEKAVAPGEPTEADQGLIPIPDGYAEQ